MLGEKHQDLKLGKLDAQEKLIKMKKIKTSIYSIVLLLSVIIGTHSCSIEKRLHSPGFHVEFHKREKTHQPIDDVQELKKQNHSLAVHTDKKEDRFSKKIDSTTDTIETEEIELLAEITSQNEQSEHTAFQNQPIRNELRAIPVKVSELMEYKTNKTSQKAIGKKQLGKAERYGGMVTGGAMDWLLPILIAIGVGLVIGLIAGLMTSSAQVFLGVAAVVALVFLLGYLMIWGLLSLIGL